MTHTVPGHSDRDVPIAGAAVAALAKRFRRVEKEARRAVADPRSDPEVVHQLRVSSRRAAAALELFEPWLARKTARDARRMVRRLRRAAGDTRSADVFLERVSAWIQDPPPPTSATAWAAVAGALVCQRERGLDRIAQTLERITPDDVHEAHLAVIGAVRANPRGQVWRHLDAFGALADHALAIRRRRVNDAGVDLTGELAQLHELRLEGKRLRYTLELTTDCLPEGEARACLAELKGMQDFLGDLNDLHELGDLVARQASDVRSTALGSGLAEPLEACERFLREEAERARSGFIDWWDDTRLGEVIGRPHGMRPDAPPVEGAMTPHENDQPTRSRHVAALDVGTNSIRLIVAEALGDDEYRVVDDEKLIVRLGAGLAETGRLSDDRIAAAAEAIKNLANVARGFNVDRLEAVATAAAREAENGQELVDTVRQVAGVELKVIGPQEEARLAYTSAARAYDLSDQAALVVDVGGGSTEVIVTVNGVIEQIYPLPLGAVKLTELFGSTSDRSSKPYHAIRAHVKEVFDRYDVRPYTRMNAIYGTGGTLTALASVAMARITPGRPGADMLPISARGFQMQRSDVRHVLHWVRRMNDRQRAALPGVSPERASILVAGVTIVDRLMRRFDVNRLFAHDGGIRDGLLLRMIGQGSGGGAGGAGGAATVDRVGEAARFAALCHSEMKDGRHVARLATRIFDQMRDEGIGPVDEVFTPANRELLEAAALLRDVGYLVNYSKHHKHSYHVIVHSNIRGFSPREIELIANIARYHRRAQPKLKHSHFAKLTEDDRRLVRCLAGILRIADGLDRTHTQTVTDVRLAAEADGIRFLIEAEAEPHGNIWGAEQRGGLFQEAFGLAPRFHWADSTDPNTADEPTLGAEPGRLIHEPPDDHDMADFEPYRNDPDLPGKLFIVEGIDGSGKSTQLDLLHKWLRSQGYCVYFSEWNSSPLVRDTTKYGKAKRLLTPATFSLIHSADFADRFERSILPPLRAGAIVLADRYIYTAFARDTARGIDPEFVRRIYRFAPKPTVPFYFHVPLKEALRRILSGRPELKFYEAGMDLNLSEDPYQSFEIFQGRILEQYQSMVSEFGLQVIDATLPIAEQQAQVRALVEPHLKDVLRQPVLPTAAALRDHGLSGRYLAKSKSE